MPNIFSEEVSVNLGKPVTMDESKEVMNSFAKDESPGLDGWTMEFYLDFFDGIYSVLLRRRG